MRPRSLHIEGFTCFADPIDIDFSGMDVFAVTGPTGAGKSTIIDAICYALYGRIPRASDVQSLMSHNRDALRVSLEFEAAGGRYRVGRASNRRRKTKRDGTESVVRELSPVQLEQFADGAWLPREGRVKELEEAVERIVGLDFDAFQRCVVLPQGRFAEFLSGDRAARNKILKELLDIGIYEILMQAANTRKKELDSDASHTEKRLAEDYADATEARLEATRAELAAAVPAREAAVALRSALTDALTSVNAVSSARRRGVERQDARKRTLAEIEEQTGLAADGAKRVAALKNDIAAKEKEYNASPYDAARHAALSAARANAIAAAKSERDLADARQAAADTSKVDLAQVSAAQAVERLSAAEAALKVATSERQAAERADAAAHVREGLNPGDPCPVCGGVLGKLPKPAASTLTGAKKAEDAALSAEKKAAEESRAAKSALERANDAQNAAKENVARIEREIASAAKDLASTLPKGVAPGASAIKEALTEQEAALSSRSEIEKKVAGLRSQLAGLEPQVNESGAALAALQAKAEQLEQEAAAAKQEGDAEMAKLKDLAVAHGWDEELAIINRRDNPRDSFELKLASATEEAERLASRITQLNDAVAHFEQAIARAAELRAEATAKRERAMLYGELGKLLRADAFQEYVISAAMGALAETATVHLRALFPRFDMIVDDGEFKVVDHWQADQMRSAKTLSGGETFIASLALALALSERLPELRSAAAARIESLFLDEGFGTLDPETLETVILALEGLRSESRMVGIVTHVPELAERIETRIIVRKAPAGSTVEIVGAGASLIHELTSATA